MKKKHLPLLLPLFCVCLLLSSCTDRASGPCQQGVDLMASDRNRAELLFWQAIALQDSPEIAHYQLAYLYDDTAEHAGMVIYHLQQYLRLSPNAPNAEETRQWLGKAQKKYLDYLNRQQKKNADGLLRRMALIEEHSIRQKQWIESLSQENERLRKQLAEQAPPLP